MNRKKFEIILYKDRLSGIAECRYHKMKCEVEIEVKNGKTVVTYYVNRGSHFSEKLRLKDCMKCPYFIIDNVKLDNGCKAEAIYRHGSIDTIILTPICKDGDKSLRYLNSIKVEVKKTKIVYKNEKK